MERIKFEDGVFDITSEEYHSSDGLSRSALMVFKKSPYHYWYKYLSGQASPEKPTPAMIFGELIHTWTLEPNLFEERFIVAPEVDRRTKEGKAIYAEFEQSVGDKFIISSDWFDIAQKICLSIRKEGSMAESLMVDSDFEMSIYFTHATTGLQCKVRPDIWNHAIVSDLKTTNDASYRAFQSSSLKYGYFLQAGMISEALRSIGIDMERFVHIAVEKEEPYAHGLYLMDDEAISFGVDQFDQAMESFARCLESNRWEAYGIQSLCLPGYAKFEVEVEV